MAANAAVLASIDGGKSTWLIWGNKRSKIDLANAPVASAIGISVDTPPRGRSTVRCST